MILTDLDTEDISGNIEQGLSSTGLYFTVYEEYTPPRLVVSTGGGTAYTTVSSGTGERLGTVVITFEKDVLIARSS